MRDFNLLEKILKRHLKRKVTITGSLIVIFLITGGVPSLARDLRTRNPEKNSIVFDSEKMKKNESINGTDVINIVNPDENGVSHNKFIDFSIGKDNGVIFNNSMENGASKIGGYLTKNPNLKNSATTILNEVTGNKVSNIDGTVEIFGNRADFILANENGINVNGGNFINTTGVTLTTGSVKRDSSGLNFDTKRGNINLNGVSTSGEYFNVLAKTIEVYKEISPLDGEKKPDISLIAGKNKIKLEDKNKKSPIITASDNEKTEKYGIYAGALGAMYGRNIRLVSTDKGLGVKHEGAIFSERDIVIDSKGDISVGTLNSGDKINIKGKNLTTTNGSIKINGKDKEKLVSAKNNINLNLEENFNLKSLLQSTDGNINIEAKGVTLKEKTSARILTKNSIALKVTDNLELEKVLIPTVPDTVSKDLIIDKDFKVKNIKSGKIYKDNEVKWIETGIFGKDIEIYAKTLKNKDIISGENVSISSDGSISNDGIVSGDKNVLIKGKDIINSGIFQSKKDIQIKNNDFLENDKKILGNSISIIAKNINNNDKINAKENIQINFENTLKNTGEISNQKNIILKGENGKLENEGQILTKEKISIDAKESINKGKLLGKEVNLKVNDNLYNEGSIQAARDLNIVNTGSKNTLLKGELKTGGSIGLDSQKSEITLEGDVLAGENLSISTGKIITNKGILASKENLTLKSNKMINEENSTIWSGKNILVEATEEIQNKKKANIVSGANLLLDAKSIVNDAGNISAGQKLTIKTDNLLNESKIENDSMIKGNQSIKTSVRWDDVFNYHIDTVTIEIPIIDNKSIIKDKAVIEANGDIEINGYSQKGKVNIVNKSGRILTTKNLKVDGDIENITNYTEYSAIDLLKKIEVTLSWETKLYGTNAHGNRGVSFKGNLYDALTNGYFSKNKEGYYKALTQTNNPFIDELISKVLGEEWKDRSKSISPSEWRLDGNLKYYATNGSAQIIAGENFNHNGNLKNNGGDSGGNKEVSVSIGSNSVDGVILNSGIKDADINKIKEVDKVKYVHDIELASGSVIIDGVTITVEPGNLKSSIAVSGTILPTIFVDIPQGENEVFKSIEGTPEPGKPLYETNIKFIDTNEFYGSQYFFEQIGYNVNNPTDNTKSVLGDTYYDYLLITKMLKSGIEYSEEISANTIKTLIENAGHMSKKLGLVVGQPLNKEQINGLERDIVWYVELEVDGNKVLAPQIYFAKENRVNIATNGGKGGISSINVGGNFISQGDSFINSNGSVYAKRDIIVENNNEIKNENLKEVKGGISSGGNISLNTSGNIDIIGGNIEGKKEVEIVADKDINVVGSKISSKNIKLRSDGNLNIKNIYEVNSEASYNYGNYEAMNTTGSSAISKGTSIEGGNIDITGKNVNITGSDIVTKDEKGSGIINISAADNVNIENSKDLYHSQSNGYKTRVEKGLLKITSESKDENLSLAKESKIDAVGTLNITSGKNMVLKGSNISSKNNTEITAARDINILDGRDEYSSNTSNTSFQVLGFDTSNEKKSVSTSKSTNINSGKNLNLVSNLDIKVVNGKINSSGKTNINAIRDVEIEAGKNEIHEEIHSTGIGLYTKGYAGVGNEAVSGEISAFKIKQAEGSPTASLPTYPTGSGGTMLDPTAYGSVGIKIENYSGTLNKTTWENSNVEGQNINITSKNNIDIGGGNFKAKENINVEGKGIFSKKFVDTSSFKENGFSLYLEDNAALESSIVDVSNKMISMMQNGKDLDPVAGTLESVGAVSTLLFNDAVGVGNYLKVGFVDKTTDINSSKENITNIEGKNISLTTTGNNLNLVGADLSATEDVNLKSAKDINILSAKNKEKSHKLTADGELRFGQGAAVNPISGAGVGMNLGFHGSADTTDETTNEEIQSKIAGKNIYVKSSENLNLKGGNVEAKENVKLEVDKDVNIESTVSSKRSDKKFGSVGGRVGIGLASNTIVRGNASAAVGGGHVFSNEETLATSGIMAGNEITTTIKRDLNIKGGALGSKEKKGSVEVGNNINLEDINTNSKKGGVDIVASVGQAGEVGVTGTIADKLDKKVVTSSAIVVENLSNNGNITIDREKRENKDIERDEKNIEKIIENSSSKGGTFSIIGPVKAGANATKSHRTGSYDVN